MYVIDNYDSFTYNLVQLISCLYPNVKVIRNDQMTCEEIAGLNPKGIVISPGPGRPEDAGVCIELIQRLSARIPILGVCLGHQAIAKAFGGDVVAAPEICHGKVSSVFHSGKGLFQNLPQPFKAGRYHSLVACGDTLPDVLRIDARTENGSIMGLKHKIFPCYGLQFHPESILTPCGKDLMGAFIQKEMLR